MYVFNSEEFGGVAVAVNVGRFIAAAEREVGNGGAAGARVNDGHAGAERAEEVGVGFVAALGNADEGLGAAEEGDVAGAVDPGGDRQAAFGAELLRKKKGSVRKLAGKWIAIDIQIG